MEPTRCPHTSPPMYDISKTQLLFPFCAAPHRTAQIRLWSIALYHPLAGSCWWKQTDSTDHYPFLARFDQWVLPTTTANTSALFSSIRGLRFKRQNLLSIFPPYPITPKSTTHPSPCGLNTTMLTAQAAYLDPLIMFPPSYMHPLPAFRVEAAKSYTNKAWWRVASCHHHAKFMTGAEEAL
jgi:hypothetical protein